ncbi:hypothetical protein JZU54_07630, partial [bacterium]|nr:hypothetical protein [bacterium]
ALSAETSSRLTLANTTANNQAALVQNYITKTDIDGAIAIASNSLRAYADKAQSDAAATTGAGIDNVESTQLGYATLVGQSSPFDGDGVT